MSFAVLIGPRRIGRAQGFAVGGTRRRTVEDKGPLIHLRKRSGHLLGQLRKCPVKTMFHQGLRQRLPRFVIGSGITRQSRFLTVSIQPQALAWILSETIGHTLRSLPHAYL